MNCKTSFNLSTYTMNSVGPSASLSILNLEPDEVESNSKVFLSLFTVVDLFCRHDVVSRSHWGLHVIQIWLCLLLHSFGDHKPSPADSIHNEGETLLASDPFDGYIGHSQNISCRGLHTLSAASNQES